MDAEQTLKDKRKQEQKRLENCHVRENCLMQVHQTAVNPI